MGLSFQCPRFLQFNGNNLLFQYATTLNSDCQMEKAQRIACAKDSGRTILLLYLTGGRISSIFTMQTQLKLLKI